ncbi:MAG: hypothetical protein ACE3L7_05010 [Candidatus Pristimantibacillus sp.]
MSRLKLIGVYTCGSCGLYTYGEPNEAGATMECVRCGEVCDNEFDHAYLAHKDQKWNDYDELPITCEQCNGAIDDFYLKSLEEQFDYLIVDGTESFTYASVCQNCQQSGVSNELDEDSGVIDDRLTAISPYTERQNEIIYRIAKTAEAMPLLESGLWFHDDIRNNFYYASYLFAASVRSELNVEFDRVAAIIKAEAVLMEVLELQNRKPDSQMYGHWPLRLNPIPREAAPHGLPVEIMGNLMAYFFMRYEQKLSNQLRGAFTAALNHVYQSGFFRKPITVYNHHEAKYTAAKLIFGSMFKDEALLEDGRQSLTQTLQHIQAKGMPEYGCLPWFWHWVQAFTAALEIIGDNDEQLQGELENMLDYLWHQRALFYLKGAYVGAHSRGWPHDMPGDANVLHDYVQFGDFELPPAMPRTEYAGFLFYEAAEETRRLALDRHVPTEVTKITEKVIADTEHREPPLHSYAYITESYAAGGLWERVQEFDNEQLRWCFSLPVTESGGANQLYFFHPGQGHNAGDPRHQSGYTEVLYHKNVIMALYPVPASEKNLLIGVLPKGEWLKHSQALFGHVNGVYFAVYLSVPYEIEEREGYWEVAAVGLPGGVVIEAMEVQEAEKFGVEGLESFG